MAKREGPYKSVGSLLDSMRLPASVKETVRNHEIWSKWVDIVGEELARVTSPVDMKGRVLKVTVAHQAWAQQLHFLKPSVLNKIKTICPNTNIQDLKFRVGEVLEVPRRNKEDDFIKKNAELSERQKMTLRAVEDPELRDALQRAMEAAAAR